MFFCVEQSIFFEEIVKFKETVISVLFHAYREFAM